MSARKRKKYSKDIKCVFFPDEVNHSVQKGSKDTALSVTSSDKSWGKCGDSFLDIPVIKKPKPSGRTLSAIRKLPQALALGSCVTEDGEEPLHIAWSDSDKSEDETKQQHVLKVVPKKRSLKSTRAVAPFQSYTSALNLLTDNNEESPVIDTDSDIIQSEEEGERDSGQLISDCDSNVSDETLGETAPNPTNPLELEISGYESDDASDTVTFNTADCSDGRERSLSRLVRSAQALLQTPQKVTEKQSKTPEDSAKKRRKFQSGGLAERLQRLQCRQKSAISFWRHKSVSDATTVDRPGVLVLEVLEAQEECSMRLVRCEHYSPPAEGHRDDQGPSEERAPLLVLFNKETAAQLNPLPKDVIHIYPPWQSLSVEGVDYDIILNTHFSQKVSSSSESAITSLPSLTALKRTPYSLDNVFGQLEVRTTTEGHNNKRDIHLAIGDSITGPGHCQSLLDAIEALGQAGSVGQLVEVVVQRIYSIPVPDSCSGSVLKHRIKSSTVPPAAEKRTRLCVLVQDSYGMFSVVQLHLLASKDDPQKYSQMWQGRTCLLRTIKVIQRVTRDRHARLFGLIDSLWPPLVPVKHHGSTASLQNESRAAGPPPSFCYLLCGQESSVEPSEDPSASPLYFPPTMQTLKELMQSELKSCRCSFIAKVLHNITQSNVGQGEMWLALTDPSLQEEQLEGPLKRTVTLCVSASCVLTSSVLEALNNASACRMSFTDVIREHGVFLCAEQSVVELCPLLTEPTVQSGSGSLGKPVRLDVLDSEVTPCSLCTVSGVIVGVDESTAYSWPACNYCGSDHLEMLTHQGFHCVSCKSILNKPETKVQLEVILNQPSLKDSTIKIKLQKKTILSLLNMAELEGGEFSGCDVESILGKELGPLDTYVRLITRKPSLWIGLEEISL
ncbi:DNA repair-scaffolding protein isoform X2 [Eucyclogobius newberryi]|uniref:DNA repair-scaffolding protein isoform X2 n=1 Tax=Eucyclogobius newberryi TaxID=166745 RepID=UPI003B5C0110